MGYRTWSNKYKGHWHIALLGTGFPSMIRQMESSRFQRSRKEWATIASISNNYLDVLVWLTGSRIHSTIVEHEGRNLREDGGDCLKIILRQRRTLTFERFRYENTLLWNQHFSSYVILHHREFVEQQDMVFKRVHEKIAIQGCIIKWISDRCPVEIWCSIPSFSIHRSWEAEQGTTEDGVFEQILRSFLSLWCR